MKKELLPNYEILLKSSVNTSKTLLSRYKSLIRSYYDYIFINDEGNVCLPKDGDKIIKEASEIMSEILVCQDNIKYCKQKLEDLKELDGK